MLNYDNVNYGSATVVSIVLQLPVKGLWSSLRAFEQGEIFIVPYLLWHGASVFPVSSEEPPHSVDSYDIEGNVEDLF
jgi:hypothetical protein